MRVETPAYLRHDPRQMHRELDFVAELQTLTQKRELLFLHFLQTHPCMALHDLRTAVLAHDMRLTMGLNNPDELAEVMGKGLLHDIGKEVTDPNVLYKPDKLDILERIEMERHTADGEDILTNLNFPQGYIVLARNHQVRYDGKGYPAGTAFAELDTDTAIYTVIDPFDAMSDDRRDYIPPLHIEEAIQLMQTFHTNGRFKPELYKAFCEMMNNHLYQTLRILQATPREYAQSLEIRGVELLRDYNLMSEDGIAQILAIIHPGERAIGQTQ